MALFLAMCSYSAHALEGRVIDGTTGQPLAGVYVIGAWRVGGGLVIANTSCAKLDLRHTDLQGRFEMPNSTGRIFAHLFASESLSVYVYKPGYQLEEGRVQPVEKMVLTPQHGAWDRLKYIGEIMQHAECGDDKGSMANRLDLFKAMYSDVSSFATTRKERVAAAKILYAIESIEQGEATARQQYEMRERAEWQRP